MMRKPQILFVEQYYYPEGWGGAQLPRDVTISWARLGWRVEVLCGSEQYSDAADELIEDPRRHGVSIRKVPRFMGRNVRKGKILRQLWFCAAAAPHLLFGARPRVIVAQTNPPLAIVLLAWVAALRGLPLVIIAQDVYPEVMFAHGMLESSATLSRLLTAAFGWAYRRADAVVSLGPRMTARLMNKGVAKERIWMISNWATGDTTVVRGAANTLLSEWRLRDSFVLLYSGNLGAAHDCDTLLRGFARALPLAPALRLVIVGGGGRIDQARKLVDELGLAGRVVFKSFVPFSLLPQTFGIADLGVVTLLPGFDGLVVPSKLLANMARGIATVYIGPEGSDVDVFIRESGGGLTIINGDFDGFARGVAGLAADPARLREMGHAARRYYDEFLSRDIGIAHYGRLLTAVAGNVESD